MALAPRQAGGRRRGVSAYLALFIALLESVALPLLVLVVVLVVAVLLAVR
jgi:hypothetical protein